MAVRILTLALLVLSCPLARAGDEPSWRGPWKGIPELVPILRSVAPGKRILALAAAKDPAFLSKIRIGQASYTESTFARTYSLLDGQEQIDLHHDVTLNQKLPLGDAVVDLAHELVHFAEKQMLDPYRPGFELKEFVRRGIEGQGGELQALEQECLVAWALQRKYPGFPRHRLCAPYRQKGDAFHRDQARKDYFAVGSWLKEAPPSLRDGLPELSSRGVVFTSSYARKPYPIALSEEFEATLAAACANNRRKYQLISVQATGGRVPASDQLQRERMRLKTYEKLYCRPPGTYLSSAGAPTAAVKK